MLLAATAVMMEFTTDWAEHERDAQIHLQDHEQAAVKTLETLSKPTGCRFVGSRSNYLWFRVSSTHLAKVWAGMEDDMLMDLLLKMRRYRQMALDAPKWRSLNIATRTRGDDVLSMTTAIYSRREEIAMYIGEKHGAGMDV